VELPLWAELPIGAASATAQAAKDSIRAR
jgi:hypothetical protein